MDKILNKILIIDGSYLLHRQLHLPNMFELRNSKGERSGGVFGFIRSLNKEITNCPSYFPVVTFDKGLSQRRISVDKYYKHADERDNAPKLITKEEIDNDYITQYRKQRTKLAEILPYFGIPVLMYDGWEGDDLIYILSQMSTNSIILTDDRDMLQLLSESCDIKRPMANEHWKLEKFLGSTNYIDTFDFVIYKAIIGDDSDNIPSACKGVGEKTILPLIRLVREFSLDRNKNEWYNLEVNFPKTEEQLRHLCDNFNIQYKKAYLNFDVDRFIKNVSLVDLTLIDNIDDIIRSMKATLRNCNNGVDFFKLMAQLSSLGIYDVPVESLIANVLVRHRNLFIKE